MTLLTLVLWMLLIGLCALLWYNLSYGKWVIGSVSSCRFPIVQILITKDIKTRQQLREQADKAWAKYQQAGWSFNYSLTKEHRGRRLVENQEAEEILQYFCHIHPELASLYDLYHRIQRPVMKADLMRYVVLYLYGGLYADVSKFIDAFWVSADTEAVFFTEAYLNSEQRNTVYPIRKRAVESECLPKTQLYEYRHRIFNGIMLACKPRLKLFYRMIELVHHRLSCLGTKTSSDYDVLFLTGPDIPSTVVREHREDSNVQVVPYWLVKRILTWDTSLHSGWREQKK